MCILVGAFVFQLEYGRVDPMAVGLLIEVVGLPALIGLTFGLPINVFRRLKFGPGPIELGHMCFASCAIALTGMPALFFSLNL